MGGIFASLMQHHHVGHRKGMSLEICRMVDVECTVNVLQRGFAIQRCGVNKVIVGPVHRAARGLQAIIGFKPIVPRFITTLDLINRKAVLLRRFIASRRIFLHSHTGCGGLLRDLGLHLFLIVLQGLVKVGQLRRLRQLILALIEKRAALLHIIKNGMEIGGLLRRQFLPGKQGPSGFLFHVGEITMQLHIRNKLTQQHIPFRFVLLPAL